MTALLDWPRFSRRHLLFGFLTLAGATVLAGQRPEGTTLEDYLARLQYQTVLCARSLNELKVDGRLNTRNVRLLVDTGWDYTALTPANAAGLKRLDPLHDVLKDPFWGVITNAKTVIMDKLVLGKAEFRDQPAQVRKLNFDYISSTPDGILGCDFFLRNSCLIDCGAARMYLRANKPSAEQAAALAESLRRSGFAEVPARFHEGLVVEAQINGQTVRVAVDTGSTFSILDQSQVSQLGLTTVKWDRPHTGSLIPEDAAGIIVGVGKIGAHQLKVTTFKTLQIGPRVWRNVHWGVADLKAWGIADPKRPGVGIQGLFGADMLEGQGTLIDFASAKLWFRPEKPRK